LPAFMGDHPLGRHDEGGNIFACFTKPDRTHVQNAPEIEKGVEEFREIVTK